jgi:hypothetical protein
MEAYPDIIHERLQQRARDLQKLPDEHNGVRVKLVAEKEARRWKPGTVVTVAFEAGKGDAQLRKTIEETARIWTEFANLTFDFRDQSTGKYREFSADDNSYSASIRISFRTDNAWGGYWSAIGKDSINEKYYRVWEPSMNLGGLDTEQPQYVVGTILHEFGHALGAHHEHMHPGGNCDDEWRWDDDAGYVSTTDEYASLTSDKYGRWPGIYTLMSGAPNYWSRSKVDSNLRQLKDASAYDTGPFDKDSIMKYYYESSFYKKGKDSPCYSDETNSLSRGDKEQIAKLYPRDASFLTSFARKRIDALATMKQLTTAFPSNLALEAAIESLNE